MVGWNAGCGESRLSGVGGAGRKPTAEKQQGAVLRPHVLNQPRVRALVGQGEAAGMAQHVRDGLRRAGLPVGHSRGSSARRSCG